MLNRSASLAMSTCVLKALPGKLDIKRHSPSILYIILTIFLIAWLHRYFYCHVGVGVLCHFIVVPLVCPFDVTVVFPGQTLILGHKLNQENTYMYLSLN